MMKLQEVDFDYKARWVDSFFRHAFKNDKMEMKFHKINANGAWRLFERILDRIPILRRAFEMVKAFEIACMAGNKKIPRIIARNIPYKRELARVVAKCHRWDLVDITDDIDINIFLGEYIDTLSEESVITVRDANDAIKAIAKMCRKLNRKAISDLLKQSTPNKVLFETMLSRGFEFDPAGCIFEGVVGKRNVESLIWTELHWKAPSDRLREHPLDMSETSSLSPRAFVAMMEHDWKGTYLGWADTPMSNSEARRAALFKFLAKNLHHVKFGSIEAEKTLVEVALYYRNEILDNFPFMLRHALGLSTHSYMFMTNLYSFLRNNVQTRPETLAPQ